MAKRPLRPTSNSAEVSDDEARSVPERCCFPTDAGGAVSPLADCCCGVQVVTGELRRAVKRLNTSEAPSWLVCASPPLVAASTLADAPL